VLTLGRFAGTENGEAVFRAQSRAMKPEPNRRCWLAAYTRSRHEQHVSQQLEQKNLEYLLPTYTRLARWTDRIKRVTTPLFPGYVFVHISERERLPLLETIGVVRLVSTAGEPAVLSDEEVERVRSCCSGSADIEPHPYLKIGRRVRVKHGPFAGWEGTLLEKQNSRRLVITVEQIMKSIAINIHSADVEPA
jgi:transcription termination/antitermination protein NusG